MTIDILTKSGERWVPKICPRNTRNFFKVIEPNIRRKISTQALKTCSHCSYSPELTPSMSRPENLTGVRFIQPSTLHLTFADDSFDLPIESLGIPVGRIRWELAKLSPAKNAMILKAIKGEIIPIDSATLRYLVDKDYAATVDTALNDIRLGDDELERLARDSQPPQEWYDKPEDLRLESWK